MKWFRLEGSRESRKRASSQNDLHWNPLLLLQLWLFAWLKYLFSSNTLDFLACGQKATMVGKSQYHTAFLRLWHTVVENIPQKSSYHTGAKTHFLVFIQKFPWFWCYKNVNLVKNKNLEMWILWKLRFQKCEFGEKWDFRNVNFVKNKISERWILWKWDFRNVNFMKNDILEMWILWKIWF